LAEGRAVVGIDIGKRTHAATALSLQGEILAQLASFPKTRAGLNRLEQEVLLLAATPAATPRSARPATTASTR
jgi:hypothetical protein